LAEGRRRLLIGSDVVTLRQIHFVGGRTQACEGGPPWCAACGHFRTLTYGYVYGLVQSTHWGDSVPQALRKNPPLPWCWHELTEQAAADLVKVGESRGLDSLRGLAVDLTRSKGGRLGRMRAWDVPHESIRQLDCRLTVPDLDKLLTFLYSAKRSSNLTLTTV
jgi:hypothetical protein